MLAVPLIVLYMFCVDRDTSDSSMLEASDVSVGGAAASSSLTSFCSSDVLLSGVARANWLCFPLPMNPVSPCRCEGGRHSCSAGFYLECIFARIYFIRIIAGSSNRD